MGKKENIRLTEKVEVISYGSASDGAGGTIPVKQVLFEMYVAIEQLQTRKDIEQAQMTLPLTYRVKSRKAVEVGNIISWKGKEFVVTSTPYTEDVRRVRYYYFDMIKQV